MRAGGGPGGDQGPPVGQGRGGRVPAAVGHVRQERPGIGGRVEDVGDGRPDEVGVGALMPARDEDPAVGQDGLGRAEDVADFLLGLAGDRGERVGGGVPDGAGDAADAVGAAVPHEHLAVVQQGHVHGDERPGRDGRPLAHLAGSVMALETVTVRAVEVVMFPAASRARAARVWFPLPTVRESQVME